MIRAFSFWQPAASMVAIAPARSSASSGPGIAATSLEPSGTATWPRVSRPWAAQALTACRRPVAEALLARRLGLPPTATGTRPVAWHAWAIQRQKRSADALGSSLAKTRPNVSGLGTPLGSARKRRKDSCLVTA
jgi:hypothetical protein